MTKIAKASLVVLIGSSVLAVGANEMKLYDIKSGKIEYTIKGSGTIMGSKMQSVGKKRVIFDAYGAQNLTEENKIDQQTIMGQKQTNKSHTLTYMKNGMVYTANFDHRRIMRMQNMGMAMGALTGGGKNMKQSGEAMMKQMGGKKTGTDKVLGYTCDVWDLMGTKQCMYKGIPLKVESNIMGVKNTEVATKAEFDISLSKDDFKLPDFPIYDMEGNKLNKNSLDVSDAKQSAKMSEEMDAMALKKAAFAKAMKDAGVKPGQTPTKAQQEAGFKAMVSAMDGDSTLLNQQKNEILAKEKVVRFLKGCLTDADSLSEANSCNQKANSMSGDTEENFSSWNAQTKEEILSDINGYLGSFDCIKGADSFKALRQCMPQE